MTPRERAWIGGAFFVSLVATLWSLTLSGIGPLDWKGMGLFPCELCWYQRILMYPLPVLLGIGLLTHDARSARYALALSSGGFLVASYHVLVQNNPSLEVGKCFVGSCASVDWMFLGVFTIPQLSAIAFALVVAATATVVAGSRKHA